VAGERRLRCILDLKKRKVGNCKTADGRTAPADTAHEFVPVKEIDPENDLIQLQYAIAENLEHAQVADWDTIFLCTELEKKYSAEQIGTLFNRSPAWVSHTLSLAHLPQPILTLIQSGRLTRTAAIHLLTAQQDKMAEVVEKAQLIVEEDIRQQLEEASRTKMSLELNLDGRQIETRLAHNNDRLIATFQNDKKTTVIRNQIQTADKRINSLRERLNRKEISSNAIDQALDQIPDAIREGAIKKARSPKTVRTSMEELQALLDGSTVGDELVTDTKSGQSYHRQDVEVLIASMNWQLGKGGASPLSVLDRLGRRLRQETSC
jgi:hypothetical protein